MDFFLFCFTNIVLFMSQGRWGVYSQVNSRIVGGADTNSMDWPWQVSLTYQSYPVCGGTIIGVQWVMTACHCFPPVHSYKDYQIKLGTNQLKIPDANLVVRGIADVIKNPVFKDIGSSGDIALVKLDSPVPFNDYIKPVALPSASSQFPAGMKCFVTGWGEIQQGVSLTSGILQVAEVPIIGQRTCNCLYHINPSDNELHEVHQDMICAGYLDGNKDACQGDSGGPLSCYTQGTWYQVGVVSWGDLCGARNRPGVYIMTSVYADWVRQYVPDVTISDVTIDVTPTPEEAGGCLDADGNFHADTSIGLTAMVSLIFFSLAVHLMVAF
ncbi:prostasin [Rhinatrema bivittatum]|uniref:prostasin n=1 Tax=Rhinatrema bivittatum TaxID=194408 RepID=UPI00112A240A|nr:prostasin [Rhinatrema bivittatum]